MHGLIGVLVFLAVGAFSGWLAGRVFRGAGFGLVWNIILGIVGGVIGGWLFGSLFGEGWVASIITAVIGAVILLWIATMIRKK